MKRLPKGFTFMESKNCYRYRFVFDGQRYDVYGQTIKECESKADEKKENLKNHLHIENIKMTFQKYYEEWLSSRKGVVKDSTLYDNQKRYSQIPDSFRKLKIIDINRFDIISLQKHLAKSLTTGGVAHTLALVSTIMNSAIADRIINYNPCKAVKPLKRTEPKSTDSNHRALTLDEQKLFFKYAENDYYYNLYRFMICTGCRLGEASALTWKDIDYQKNVIHITKTVSRISDKEFIVSDSTKTESGTRDIPLTDQVKCILSDQKEQNLCLSVRTFDNRIFSTSGGKLVVPSNTCGCIKSVLRRIEKAEDIKIEKFSSHAFRSTFATRCIEQGMQPQTLKTILGHKKLSITMDLYAHVLPNTKESEMNRIEIAI